MVEIGKIRTDQLIEKYGSPLYVYNEEILRTRIKELKQSIVYPKKQILFACKSNTNIHIMKILREEGAWIDAVSPWEAEIAFRAGFERTEILYTGDNVTDDEMRYCLKNGIMQNLGSLSQIERYGKMSPKSDICIRINPDCGAGHHGHTITGGPESKFGIYFDKINDIKSLADKYQLKITGIHSHIGSGILDINEFLKAIDIVLNSAKSFNDLEFIDFGGGIGIPYRPTDKPVDIKEFGKKVSEKFQSFSNSYGRELKLYLEPGRYLVAESGTLLITVNNRKETPTHQFVGTDSGFNHLIRPMAYGSYHEIINCTNPEGEIEEVAVSGNICESGDVFTQGENGIENRPISKIREGDILAVKNAGAYGFSMASHYNTRPKPAEVLVYNGKDRLIRRRDTFEDLTASMNV